MDQIRLPQFPSVAANAKSTLVTDKLRGMSLHALQFKRGGTFTNAHLSGIRVSIGGKDVTPLDLTGAHLVDLNEYDGLTDVTGHTFLFFGDPTARTIRGQHLGDIDFSVYGREPIGIDVSIGGATNPTLEVIAHVGPPKLDMNAGFDAKDAATLRALIRTQIQFNAAISRKSYGLSLGSQAGAKLRRAALFHTNLTSVEFKKQSIVKHDDISIDENAAFQQQYARTPQAGLYMLDRIVDANQGEAEETVRRNGTPWSLELNLTASAGDTVTAYADVHTVLGAI